MVTVRLKGLYWVNAKGKRYYYAWKGGPRLEGDPNTPEFQQAFHDAHAAKRGEDKQSFGGWVRRYRAHKKFQNLAPRTRKEWEPWLDRIETHFGPLSIAQFDRPQIRLRICQWRDRWADTPRTADYGKQVLSRVLSFACENGALALNPCKEITNLYSADRSEIIWTAADLERLCAATSREIAWAAKLACLTGFRQGDLLRLSWGHVGSHAIEIATGKSRRRKKASAPLTSSLRALLGEIKAARKGKLAITILTNSRGEPWRGFNSSWTKAMADAFPEGSQLHFHDMRGTAATNFFRAGLALREIAEIMGWAESRVERLIDTYVKRDEILADRVRRIERAEGAESFEVASQPIES